MPPLLRWSPLLAVVACRPGAEIDWTDPEVVLEPGEAVQAPVDPALVSPVVSPKRPNVLLIIADDVGTDKIGAYAVDPRAPRTPNIDALAARGVTYDRAWAMSVCSPTRSTLLTGRYPLRYGIGQAIDVMWGRWALPVDEPSLPRMLDEATDDAYSAIALGKWHMAAAFVGSGHHPYDMGFDLHLGSPGNIMRDETFDGSSEDYYRWFKLVDQQLVETTTYATLDTTNDAVREIPKLQEPWLTWLAYNAAHSPYQMPPEDMWPRASDATLPQWAIQNAMIEVMDAEIGRVLDAIDPEVLENTLVLFMGDNGTPNTVVLDPYDPGRTKTSVYEGGVRIPFIVAGPWVGQPGTRSDALVSVADVYATLADGLDADVEIPDDSVSFLHTLVDPSLPARRSWLYTEIFRPPGPGPWEHWERAVRDDRFKLIRTPDAEDELYNLAHTWPEGQNLYGPNMSADAREAWIRLDRLLTSMEGAALR